MLYVRFCAPSTRPLIELYKTLQYTQYGTPAKLVFIVTVSINQFSVVLGSRMTVVFMKERGENPWKSDGSLSGPLVRTTPEEDIWRYNKSIIDSRKALRRYNSFISHVFFVVGGTCRKTTSYETCRYGARKKMLTDAQRWFGCPRYSPPLFLVACHLSSSAPRGCAVRLGGWRRLS